MQNSIDDKNINKSQQLQGPKINFQILLQQNEDIEQQQTEPSNAENIIQQNHYQNNISQNIKKQHKNSYQNEYFLTLPNEHKIPTNTPTKNKNKGQNNSLLQKNSSNNDSSEENEELRSSKFQSEVQITIEDQMLKSNNNIITNQNNNNYNNYINTLLSPSNQPLKNTILQTPENINQVQKTGEQSNQQFFQQNVIVSNKQSPIKNQENKNQYRLNSFFRKSIILNKSLKSNRIKIRTLLPLKFAVSLKNSVKYLKYNLNYTPIAFLEDLTYFRDDKKKKQNFFNQFKLRGSGQYMENSVIQRKRKQSISKIQLQQQHYQKQSSGNKSLQKQNTITNVLPKVIHPDNIILYYFDLLHLILIVFCLFIIPIQFFVKKEFKEDYGIYVKSMFLASVIVFFIDIVLEFNVGYYYKGQIELSRSKISQRYLKFNFWMDLLCIIPLILTLTKQYESFYWILDILIIWKIEAIVSLLHKYHEILLMKKNYIFPIIIRLIRLFILMLFMAHIFACAYLGIGVLEMHYEKENWIEKYSPFEGVDNYLYLYFYSLYLTVQSMTSVGYGDITASNVNEVFYLTWMMLLTCFTFAYSFNVIGNIVKDMNKKEHQFVEDMRLFSRYFDQYKTDRDLQIQIRKYIEYRHQADSDLSISENYKVMELVSSELKQKLLISQNKSYLQSVPFIKQSLENKQIEELSLKMVEISCINEQIIFEENQFDQNDYNLYFIADGQIQISLDKYNDPNGPKVVKILKKGDYFGQLEFLTEQQYLTSASSIGSSYLLKLSKFDYLKVIKKQPKILEKFQELVHDLKLKQSTKDMILECYICKRKGHYMPDCPSLHYIPDKEKLQLQYHNTSSKDSNSCKQRSYFQRNENKKDNAKLARNEVELDSELLEEQLFDELYFNQEPWLYKCLEVKYINNTQENQSNLNNQTDNDNNYNQNTINKASSFKQYSNQNIQRQNSRENSGLTLNNMNKKSSIKEEDSQLEDNSVNFAYNRNQNSLLQSTTQEINYENSNNNIKMQYKKQSPSVRNQNNHGTFKNSLFNNLQEQKLLYKSQQQQEQNPMNRKKRLQAFLNKSQTTFEPKPINLSFLENEDQDSDNNHYQHLMSVQQQTQQQNKSQTKLKFSNLISSPLRKRNRNHSFSKKNSQINRQKSTISNPSSQIQKESLKQMISNIYKQNAESTQPSKINDYNKQQTQMTDNSRQNNPNSPVKQNLNLEQSNTFGIAIQQIQNQAQNQIQLQNINNQIQKHLFDEMLHQVDYYYQEDLSKFYQIYSFDKIKTKGFIKYKKHNNIYTVLKNYEQFQISPSIRRNKAYHFYYRKMLNKNNQLIQQQYGKKRNSKKMSMIKIDNKKTSQIQQNIPFQRKSVSRQAQQTQIRLQSRMNITGHSQIQQRSIDYKTNPNASNIMMTSANNLSPNKKIISLKNEDYDKQVQHSYNEQEQSHSD